MSWHPSDLVSDQDLADYEPRILTQFGKTSWASLRTKVLEDWLFPILKAEGLDPYRLRTRFDADKVFGYTSSAYTDLTDEASDTTEDDINLGTVLAASTDYLYVGSKQPFRGLHARFVDSGSAVAATLTVEYWADEWTELTVTDGTEKSAGVPFSGGGSLTWSLPVDWTIRKVNSSDALYWLRLKLSAAPTNAKATQVGVIRQSLLRAPATFRVLMWIFADAPTGQPGPWQEKAERYEKASESALARALPQIGGEFDTITESDQIDADEAAQTTAEVSQGGGSFLLERG